MMRKCRAVVIMSNGTKAPTRNDNSNCVIIMIELNAPASFNAIRIRSQERIDRPIYVIDMIKAIFSAYIPSPA